MRLFLSAVLLVLFTTAYAQADSFDLCKEKWGDNYSMQEYCVKQQLEAKEAVDSWYGEYGNFDLLNKCTEKWTEDFEPNYRMIMYCLKKQQKSLDWLQAHGG